MAQQISVLFIYCFSYISSPEYPILIILVSSPITNNVLWGKTKKTEDPLSWSWEIAETRFNCDLNLLHQPSVSISVHYIAPSRKASSFKFNESGPKKENKFMKFTNYGSELIFVKKKYGGILYILLNTSKDNFGFKSSSVWSVC